MSLLSGSVSLSRYRVVGMPARLSLAKLQENFGPLCLKPINLRQSRLETHFGWVKPLGLGIEDLPEDADWGLSESRIGSGLMLRMRFEKRKVPSQLLQAMVRQKISKLEERRQGKGVARDEKKAIGDEMRQELLERALPQINFFDAYWDLDTGNVAFFSVAKSARTTFEELFRKSFSQPHGFMMLPLQPPLLGLRPQEWEADGSLKPRLQELASCIPSQLTLRQHQLTL